MIYRFSLFLLYIFFKLCKSGITVLVLLLNGYIFKWYGWETFFHSYSTQRYDHILVNNTVIPDANCFSISLFVNGLIFKRAVS